MAHWYRYLTSFIVVTWITGRMTFAVAQWLIRCCIFLLMRLVRCFWHCSWILLRQYKKGNLRLHLREIPTLCFLCYSFSDAMDFDSLHNPGVIGLFKIVVDSGASFCYTFDRRDFIEGTYRDIDNLLVRGIAKELNAIGKGRVRWYVLNDKGEKVAIEMEAYLLPSLPIRLLSPQQLARQYPSTRGPAFAMYNGHSFLNWNNNVLHLRLDRTSNLPLLYAESRTISN